MITLEIEIPEVLFYYHFLVVSPVLDLPTLYRQAKV